MTSHGAVESPRLRRATASDLMLYFEWVNDPDVRRNSFDATPIPLERHCAWFAAKLDSPEVLMLVLEAGGAVGQIRFDVSDDVAMIGFSLSSAARGRGLGSFLLRAAPLHLRAAYPQVRTVRGLVKSDNAASRRAFEAAGFRLTRESSDAGGTVFTYDLGLE